MPLIVRIASSNNGLAVAKSPLRMASRPFRYSQRTRSFFGTEAGPEKFEESVACDLGCVAQPPARAAAKTAAPQIMDLALDTGALTVSGVFQTLFLHISRIFPNDFARARINQLKAIQNVIARAGARAGAH